MQESTLQLLIAAFNNRDFDRAVSLAGEGLMGAEGRSEAFWIGLNDACEGFRYLKEGTYDRAELKMVGAMQKLRNFGFRFENFEVTSLLAGLRRCAAEIRAVKAQEKRVFDVSLLPQLKLAARAEQLRS